MAWTGQSAGCHINASRPVNSGHSMTAFDCMRLWLMREVTSMLHIKPLRGYGVGGEPRRLRPVTNVVRCPLKANHWLSWTAQRQPSLQDRMTVLSTAHIHSSCFGARRVTMRYRYLNTSHRHDMAPASAHNTAALPKSIRCHAVPSPVLLTSLIPALAPTPGYVGQTCCQLIAVLTAAFGPC